MRCFKVGVFVVIALFLFAGNAYAYDDDTVLGTVAALQQATNAYGCTTSEMKLCDTVADAVKRACNSQISIINGGDFIQNLDGGEATWGDIQRLFLEDKSLAVAEISGAGLWKILEYGVSYAVVDMSTETLDIKASSFAGFPQISGFSFSYDPTAPVGQRIKRVVLADGTEVSAEMTLTLAATEYMLSGGFGYPAAVYRSLDITLAEAVAQYFDNGMIQDPAAGRITCIGLSDRFAISRPAVFVVSSVAIMLCFFFSKIRQQDVKENGRFQLKL